jgi:DNA invertase Pin-like site-specific DNA recombinase
MASKEKKTMMMNISSNDYWKISNPKELQEYMQQTDGKQALDPDRKRVVIYVRKSRIEKGATHYSPEIQEQACRARAEKEGWEVKDVIIDLDRSGRNSKREGIQEVIRMVKKRQVDFVIAHYLDRSFRNSASFFAFQGLLQKYGVDFVSVSEPFDTRTFVGRLTASIMASMAEIPVLAASERGRAAKKARFERGFHNGGYRLGYCNGLCSTCTDPNGKDHCPLFGGPDRVESQRGQIQVPHPIEQHLVRLIVSMYRQGKSDRDIAAEINAHIYQLPDGRRVQFRTKGVPNSYPPGKLSRDTVREIVRNPFHAGWVARYPTAPLSMADDLENPGTVRNPVKDRRTPKDFVPGNHEPLYPFDVWKANQQLRRSKKRVAVVDGRPKRVYLLSGTGRCHVCYENDHREVSLRGSINGSGKPVYRCTTLIDRSILRRKNVTKVDTNLEHDDAFQALMEKHDHFAIPGDLVEQQVVDLVKRLQIPQEWHERILAYYLSNDGMSEFERKGYGLRKEMERVSELYRAGHIDRLEFNQEALRIGEQLKTLKPAAHPEAVRILPLLKDWPSIWEKMNGLEHKTVLGVIFGGLYIDRDGVLANSTIYPPFDSLIYKKYPLL